MRVSLRIMSETEAIPDTVEAIDHPSPAIDDLMVSEDMVEGVMAFAAKRSPRWKNR